MCDKTMENYKPNMFQLQCLKALEIQIEEGKGYNEAEIGRKMQVNRSTISRCFKRYREEGFLEDKEFTRKGKEFLEYYKMIEADLYHTLHLLELTNNNKDGQLLECLIQQISIRSRNYARKRKCI